MWNVRGRKVSCGLWLTTVCTALVVFACSEDNPIRSVSTPKILSTPPDSVYHNDTYRYQLQAVDDDGRALTFAATALPSWLTFYRDSLVLSGEPTSDNLGSHHVALTVSNGNRATTQEFDIEVVLRQVDGGSWEKRCGLGDDFPHDGQPLETEHFFIYSDGAVDSAKQLAGDLAEESLAYVMGQLGLENEDLFQIPSYQTKIDILLVKLQYLEGAFGYYAGFMVISPDHPSFDILQALPPWYRQVFRHELTHVVEFLLRGDDVARNRIWFREGIAQYLSGPWNEDIHTLADFNACIAAVACDRWDGNPMQIRKFVDWPPDYQNAASMVLAYPLFELAVRYLVDPNGHGADLDDVTQLLIDIGADGVYFPEVFEQNFGMTEERYEADFFDLMNGYLPQ
jgi:hypothetical protein